MSKVETIEILDAPRKMSIEPEHVEPLQESDFLLKSPFSGSVFFFWSEVPNLHQTSGLLFDHSSRLVTSVRTSC